MNKSRAELGPQGSSDLSSRRDLHSKKLHPKQERGSGGPLASRTVSMPGGRFWFACCSACCSDRPLPQIHRLMPCATIRDGGKTRAAVWFTIGRGRWWVGGGLDPGTTLPGLEFHLCYGHPHWHFIGQVTLNCPSFLFLSFFFIWEVGIESYLSPTLLWWLNELTHTKYLEECLASSKFSINVIWC